ncbi:protein trichome birefringence-like 16 isoform X2 [Capsicum annuum]|uniref:protein trichome birefringence-like 16 isoform X2 n=1 Tax=Capsicum annuum TaxID=4072 RepID=UPI001FB05E2B|nr:protein trichome birefringence-like 16 isoform X2 [Capsicum annuum]
MKGGLKVPRISLILVGFVCATVITFAYVKSPFLSYWTPSQDHVFQISPGNAGIPAKVPQKGEDLKALELKNSSRDQENEVTAPVNSAGGAAENMISTLKNHGCNSAKGRWVTDDSRPLYSGSGCKRWLSSMWACRLTQRMDFEYEKLRWRPRDCEMEDFTGVNFLKRMENKTLAFIGDSLGRQQFQSLMCMITGGEDRPDVLDVGREYGLVKARHAVRPDGWAYRFPSTQTTILYYWSASLCNLTPINASNPVTDYAMHLDCPPAFLSRFLPRFDVLVLNTGHHWSRGKLNANRWVMYVDGVPNMNMKIADIDGIFLMEIGTLEAPAITPLHFLVERRFYKMNPVMLVQQGQ